MVVLFIAVVTGLVAVLSGWVYFFYRNRPRPGGASRQIGPYVHPATRPHTVICPSAPPQGTPLPPEDTGPLAYPGRRPGRKAVLLADDSLLRVSPKWGTPPGSWVVEYDINRPLDKVLVQMGAAPRLTGREPVLAVGADAAPAWLAARLASAGLRPVVPMMAANVQGITAGVSAHVSSQGYVPATPVVEPGAVGSLWIIWLDHRQLAVLDSQASSGYQRIPLPDRYQVSLDADKRQITGCWVYVSRHGYLTGPDGRPRRLTRQQQLITGLLADAPALAGIAGSTPQQWVQRARDPAVREAMQAALAAAGLVRRQAELASQDSPS